MAGCAEDNTLLRDMRIGTILIVSGDQLRHIDEVEALAGCPALGLIFMFNSLASGASSYW